MSETISYFSGGELRRGSLIGYGREGMNHEVVYIQRFYGDKFGPSFGAVDVIGRKHIIPPEALLKVQTAYKPLRAAMEAAEAAMADFQKEFARIKSEIGAA